MVPDLTFAVRLWRETDGCGQVRWCRVEHVASHAVGYVEDVAAAVRKPARRPAPAWRWTQQARMALP